VRGAAGRNVRGAAVRRRGDHATSRPYVGNATVVPDLARLAPTCFVTTVAAPAMNLGYHN
jgi:hypothetical protein